MTISRELFVDRMLSFLWGSWTGIGVPGFSPSDFELDFAIDLESLIIATGYFGEHDPRLREETISWLVTFWRSVSRGRLRNLLAAHPDLVAERLGPLAATVNAHTPAKWPDHDSAVLKVRPEPAAHRDLRQPHLLQLRLRAIFGVTAKAELIGVFLSAPRSWMTVAEAASKVGYQKRAVANALEDLAAAGTLKSRPSQNRLEFAINDAESVRGFVGAVPGHAPDWNAIFRVIFGVDLLLSQYPDPSPAAEVEIHRSFKEMRKALVASGLTDPTDIASRPGVWGPLVEWVDRLTLAVSRGDVGGLP